MRENFIMRNEVKRKIVLGKQYRTRERFKLRMKFMFNELRYQQDKVELSGMALACYYFPQ